MLDRVRLSALTCGVALAALTACSTGPSTPKGMSTTGMQESPNMPGTLVWKKPGLNAAQFSAFEIPSPDIYNGPDASFGGATEQNKQAMAQYMVQEFRTALSQQFRITDKPGPNTAKLQLTLVGFSDNVPVAATVSRVAPVGIVANVVRYSANQPPTFSGTVTIKGEFTDSVTGERLATFVTTHAPEAIDIGATLSSLDAQHQAIDGAAIQLRDGITKAQAQAAGLPRG